MERQPAHEVDLYRLAIRTARRSARFKNWVQARTATDGAFFST
jgi:hypothetical protein